MNEPFSDDEMIVLAEMFVSYVSERMMTGDDDDETVFEARGITARVGEKIAARVGGESIRNVIAAWRAYEAAFDD